MQAAPDFFAGLAGLAHHHLVERSAEEVGLCAEIMAESRRNPEIAAHRARTSSATCGRGIVAMLRSARRARARFARDIDLDAAATVLMVLADGVSWRRAVDPKFDPGSGAADGAAAWSDACSHSRRQRERDGEKSR